MLVLIRNKNNVVYVDHHNFKPEFGMIRRILYIAIPSGMENGIFQFGRIIVVSIISTFATTILFMVLDGLNFLKQVMFLL